jgi:hypothetical protein
MRIEPNCWANACFGVTSTAGLQRQDTFTTGNLRVWQFNFYVSRMINLTTLAPEIVEAILDDTLPDHLTLFDVAVDTPVLWKAQPGILG